MKIIGPLSAFLVLCFTGFSCPSGAAQNSLVDSLEIQTISNLDRISNREFGNITTSFGEKVANQRLTLISNSYPGFKILKSCGGSFKNEGDNDLAIALINVKKKLGVYLVVLSDSKREVVTEIGRYPVNFNEKGVIPKNLEVSCKSRTELFRIAREYQKVRVRSVASSASLDPISYLDSVCIAPTNEPADFRCFSYKKSSGRFISIGGWFND